MHGIPGFMFPEPSLPPLHVWPLVHVEPHPVPAGNPAATHAATVAISAAVAGAAGGGGIAIVVDCIRATATLASDCVRSIRDIAVNSATLVSDGAPAVGVRPWQAQQRAANTFSTSQGRSLAGGLT